MTIEFYDPMPQPPAAQDKPKRGRPPKNEEDKYVRRVAYVRPVVDSALEGEASERGIPVAELLREILEEWHAQH